MVKSIDELITVFKGFYKNILVYFNFAIAIIEYYLFLLKDLFSLKNLNEKNLFEIFIQIYRVMKNLVFFFIFIGMAIGIVLTIHMNYSLMDFQSGFNMPLLVTLPLLREFGPVVSSILFTATAGTALVSEIGFMKATDQLLSMDLMGISPLANVFIPRFFACLVSLPILMLIFILFGILGSKFCSAYIINSWCSSSFFSDLINNVDMISELKISFIKGLVFALFIAMVSLSLGKDSPAYTDSLYVSIIKSVIYSNIIIIILDVLLNLYFFSI